MVKKALQSSKKGMTITEISHLLKANRNSVAKYLDMLCMAGEADVRRFGRSKIYSSSDRMSLATALSLSSEMIVIIDETYRIIDVNNRFLQYADVDRNRIIGQTLETVHIDILIQPEILLNVKDALRGNEYSREISVTRKDGVNYYQFWLKPLTISDVKSKVALVYKVITGRKMAELALKESEARYRAIVEDQTELICRLAQDTTISFVNSSLCKFFCVDKSQIVGKKLVEILPVHENNPLVSNLNKLRADKKQLTYTHTHISPDGKKKFVQWTGNYIVKESDRSVEYQIIGRDTTNYVLAENARKQSEEYFQNVYDMMPVGSCIVTPDLRFSKVNCEYCRITGYTEKELMSLNMKNLLHPEDTHVVLERARDMLSGACDSKRGIKRYIRKDGTVVSVEVKVKIVRDQAGKPQYFIEMIEDVSDRISVDEYPDGYPTRIHSREGRTSSKQVT